MLDVLYTVSGLGWISSKTAPLKAALLVSEGQRHSLYFFHLCKGLHRFHSFLDYILTHPSHPSLSRSLSLQAERDWPLWATTTLEVLLYIQLVLLIADYFLGKNAESLLLQESTKDSTKGSKDAKGEKGSSSKKKLQKASSTSFRWFQLQYLSVYLIVMLADWLQGPCMYELYTSYGVDVGLLFVTGFASSAIFGTFLGVYVNNRISIYPYVDRWIWMCYNMRM